MNKVILMGRLTGEPEVRHSVGERGTSVARYRLAVDRRFSRNNGEQTADFIPCVVFGRGAEFAEKYFHKGMRVLVTGRIQTGSYTNRDGNTVYTTEVILDDQEFADSKGASTGGFTAPADNYRPSAPAPAPAPAESADGFMNIPDGIDDVLPFP